MCRKLRSVENLWKPDFQDVAKSPVEFLESSAVWKTVWNSLFQNTSCRRRCPGDVALWNYQCANRFARERHFRDDSRMVGDSATMNIMWIIHSTCLEIHLEEACGRMTTER